MMKEREGCNTKNNRFIDLLKYILMFICVTLKGFKIFSDSKQAVFSNCGKKHLMRIHI